MIVRFLKLIVLLGIYFSHCGTCLSQDGLSNGVSNKNAISLNIAGATPLLGITYERLISNKLNLEMGLGVYSVGAELKYFPFQIVDNKMVFHTAFGTNLFSTPFDTFASGDFSSTSYFVIGLTYFGNAGFNFGLSVGPSVNYDFTFDEVAQPIYGNLKLGYRF